MRWAIYGASNIAANHILPVLRTLSQTPAIVISSDLDRGRKYAADNGIETFTTDPKRVLNADVQAAYIGSRNDCHFEHTMAAIGAGLHVLCEKPMALSRKAAEQMVEAADVAGVVLAVNHHLRNNPVHIAARELIRADTIGNLLAVHVSHGILLRQELRGWRLQHGGGGVTLDLGVHDIDLVRFVTGLEPRIVTAVAAFQGMSAGPPDAVLSNAVLGESTLLSIYNAYTSPHSPTGIELHGTNGSLIGRDCLLPRPGGTLQLVVDGDRRDIDLTSTDNLYTPNVAALINAAAGHGTPVASGDDGLQSMAFALKVEEAVATSLIAANDQITSA